MRCDKKIYFRRQMRGEYNDRTGNYNAGTETLTERMADVTDTKQKDLAILYGGIKQGAFTIRIQAHYDDAFDGIVMDGKYYHVDARRRMRTKDVFFVSEVL